MDLDPDSEAALDHTLLRRPGETDSAWRRRLASEARWLRTELDPPFGQSTVEGLLARITLERTEAILASIPRDRRRSSRKREAR